MPSKWGRIYFPSTEVKLPSYSGKRAFVAQSLAGLIRISAKLKYSPYGRRSAVCAAGAALIRNLRGRKFLTPAGRRFRRLRRWRGFRT
jgi:hypothetical protein